MAAETHEQGALGRKWAQAVTAGQFEACAFLLEQGALPDLAVASDQSAALHHAASCGRLEVCDLLINAGADPNLKNALGFSPLHFAAMNNRADVCRLLILHGADVSLQDIRRNTPLHLAVQNFHPQTCTALLECGADPSFVPFADGSGGPPVHKDYLTPFMLAARAGNDWLVQQLFDTGRVDPSFATPAGMTALDAAQDHPSTQELLLMLQTQYVVEQGIARIDSPSPAPRRSSGMGML